MPVKVAMYDRLRDRYLILMALGEMQFAMPCWVPSEYLVKSLDDVPVGAKLSNDDAIPTDFHKRPSRPRRN